MATIRYQLADGHFYVIEVTEEFAAEYAAMEHRDKLIERKETRRHQSLEKSLEHGWDVADPSADVASRIEKNEEKIQIVSALKKLTDKQLTVLNLYIVHNFSFREIGEKMNLGRYTVRDYYYNAIKKLKKFLKKNDF